jgi:hypothetical protein
VPIVPPQGPERGAMTKPRQCGGMVKGSAPRASIHAHRFAASAQQYTDKS